MSTQRHFLSIIVLLITVACAPTHIVPLSAQQHASALLTRRLDDAELRQFIEVHLPGTTATWPPRRWTCDQLTFAAFYFHPDLALARAQWNAAQAALITAGGRPNPTLGITPERVSNPGGASPWIQSMVLGAPIETGGKREYRLAQALALAESAALTVDTTAWHVRHRVRQALIGFYVAQRKFALLSQQHTVLAQYARLLSQRTAQGVVSPLQAVEYTLPVSTAQLQVAQTEEALHQRRADVATALGVPMDAVQKIAIAFDDMLDLPPANTATRIALIERALTNRSDILATLKEYAATTAALQEELAKRIPDFTISPGYQWSQGAHHWLLGLSFLLPLFNHNTGPIAEARARSAVVAAQFDALQSGVLATLEHAWSSYHDDVRTLAAAQGVAAAYAHKLHTMEITITPNEAVRSTLLAAKLAATSAALTCLDAQEKALTARATLEDILQAPLPNPRDRS